MVKVRLTLVILLTFLIFASVAYAASPTVSISSPSNGVTLNHQLDHNGNAFVNLSVSATLSDDEPIAQGWIFLNGVGISLIGNNQQLTTLSVNTWGGYYQNLIDSRHCLENGIPVYKDSGCSFTMTDGATYPVTVVAKDSDGNYGSATSQVTFKYSAPISQAPVVTISVPSDNSILKPLSGNNFINLSISGSISDDDGAVTEGWVFLNNVGIFLLGNNQQSNPLSVNVWSGYYQNNVVDSIHCLDNGVPTVRQSNNKCSFTLTDDAKYPITVAAKDSLGKIGLKTVYATFDYTTAAPKLSDGSSCSSASQCAGGYCVHSKCRSSSTYCGDNYCDSGESYSSCSMDCSAPSSNSTQSNSTTNNQTNSTPSNNSTQSNSTVTTPTQNNTQQPQSNSSTTPVTSNPNNGNTNNGDNFRAVPTNPTPSKSECDGCEYGASCIPYGTRVTQNNNPVYCDIAKSLQIQKDDTKSCQNNYECRTNYCFDNVCTNVQAQLDEQKGILEYILLFLADLFWWTD